MRINEALHLLAAERLAPLVGAAGAEESRRLVRHLDEAVLLLERRQRAETRVLHGTLDTRAVLPDAGGANSAAPTVQSGGKPMVVGKDCPPDSKPKG